MLVSDCCGAAAEGNEDYGICLNCKEHCEFVEEDDEHLPIEGKITYIPSQKEKMNGAKPVSVILKKIKTT